jgi:hypothetical protein
MERDRTRLFFRLDLLGRGGVGALDPCEPPGPESCTVRWCGVGSLENGEGPRQKVLDSECPAAADKRRSDEEERAICRG